MAEDRKKPRKSVVETVQGSFPNIWNIAKLIAYDNGIINRSEPESDYVEKVATILSHHPIIWLLQLEAFLQTKNPIQQNIIAAGEHTEMMAELEDAPDADFADKLFNQFFEGE